VCRVDTDWRGLPTNERVGRGFCACALSDSGDDATVAAASSGNANVRLLAFIADLLSRVVVAN
jgi:hypothetical protein